MYESDNVLVARYVKTMDQGAFGSLAERHRDMVYATCRRILNNSADAEDATQNCFMKLAENANTIRTSPAGWLHRAAINSSINLLQKKKTQRQREVRAMQERQKNTEVDWDDLRPVLDEAVAVLPTRLRIPLILHYLEGRKQVDIAAELGINQSAVSKRLKNGIEALRKRLTKMGIVSSSATLVSLLVANSVEAAPAALGVTLAGLAIFKEAIAGGSTTVGAIALKVVVGFVVTTGLIAGGVAVKKSVVENDMPQAENAQVAPTALPIAEQNEEHHEGSMLPEAASAASVDYQYGQALLSGILVATAPAVGVTHQCQLDEQMKLLIPKGQSLELDCKHLGIGLDKVIFWQIKETLRMHCFWEDGRFSCSGRRIDSKEFVCIPNPPRILFALKWDTRSEGLDITIDAKTDEDSIQQMMRRHQQ